LPLPMSKIKFSPCQRALSFIYAFRGIYYAFRTQHNLWIHLSVMIVVIVSGVFFQLSLYEWGIVVLACGLVLTAELMNTAIEFLVDVVSPERQDKAGRIKDIAAGAVLIAAVSAAVAGLLVFLPKMILLIKS